MAEAGSKETRRVMVWGVADQMLSSATNLAASLVAAKALGVKELGAFSAAYASYVIALGIGRGVVSEPLSIRAAVRTERREIAVAVGAALALGSLIGLLLITASFMFEGGLSEALIWMGIWMPGLLVQDTMRHVHFLRRRAQSAFLNDFIWGAAFAAILVVSRGAELGVGGLVSAWGAAGSFAALVALVGSRVVPAAAHAIQWWRAQRDLAAPFTVEFLMLSGTNQAVVFAVGFAAGLAEQGAFFAALVLMGPLRVIFLGLRAVLVPEVARRLEESPALMYRAVERMAIALGLAALLWGLLLWLTPDHIGRFVLGEVWLLSRPLLPAITLVMVSNGSMTAYTAALRGLQDSGASLRARTLSSVLIVGASVTGAVLSGAAGAAWGMAVSWGVASLLWRAGTARSVAEHERSLVPTE